MAPMSSCDLTRSGSGVGSNENALSSIGRMISPSFAVATSTYRLVRRTNAVERAPDALDTLDVRPPDIVVGLAHFAAENSARFMSSMPRYASSHASQTDSMPEFLRASTDSLRLPAITEPSAANRSSRSDSDMTGRAG